MTKLLAGRRVAVLIENEFIQEEVLAYQMRFSELGAQVDLVSRLWGAGASTFWSHAADPSTVRHSIQVNLDVRQLDLHSYDAVIMAANYTSVRLRWFDPASKERVVPSDARRAPAPMFFAEAMREKSIVKGALCHGLWVLTPFPELLKDRRVICHPVVLADVQNAGAQFETNERGVVVDDDLITGWSANEVHQFIDAIVARVIEISGRGGPVSPNDTIDRIRRAMTLRYRGVQRPPTVRPTAEIAQKLLNGSLDIEHEVRRLVGVEVDLSSVGERRPILLVASKFGTWASEVSLVVFTLRRAGYKVHVATEDGAAPHFLGPSLDPGFSDGAWRCSVVSEPEMNLALRLLDPALEDGALLRKENVLNLSSLPRPPQVGDYLADPACLETYFKALKLTLEVACRYEALIIAGGSGAVPGLMADRALHTLILAFNDQRKPIIAQCNGGLALAQTTEPLTSESVIRGRAVTTHSWFDEYQGGWGWTMPFSHEMACFWSAGVFDLKKYQGAEEWHAPGTSGNPLIDSERLLRGAVSSRGLYFSPPGSPYCAVADDHVITCRTTPDGYPGTLLMMAHLDGRPPLRGRFFIDRDQLGRRSP